MKNCRRQRLFGESFYGVVKGIKCSSVSAILQKTMRSKGGGRVLQRNTESVDCVHLRVPNVTGKFAF